ncbi:exo-beta-N-acetylmuramidase NamZ family protein [Tenuifilum osseticum]|uniref:exo-beta-N-acetylmuramidase NamZ family protein n=1 Tax=Tenuifilum osseticum TaxID=3374723 RepID=UPI0034E4C74F
MRFGKIVLTFSVSVFLITARAQEILPGARLMSNYLPLIQGKRVAVVANHTTLVGSKHLVDTLLSAGVTIKKIFSPEHGFRGDIEAGELIGNYTDKVTGLPVISLYGGSKKPKPTDLSDVDVVIFDLQDVGVRFYTYISTMHYVMEACAENNKPLIILDRPNPNGFYVDGPVLDTAYRSFVGMHPVPLVHGMTIGEFAQMINGEGWLKGKIQCNLTVIPCRGYTHSMTTALPVRPSPNLPNHLSILLYPSLGLFEGTVVSVGRGTDYPFQVFGFPNFPDKGFRYIPVEKRGASLNPPYKGKPVYGIDLRDYSVNYFLDRREIILDWLIYSYNNYPEKDKFFNNFFNLLAGTSVLRQQIENGLTPSEIRATWQPALEQFKLLRKKYLLYPDFE